MTDTLNMTEQTNERLQSAWMEFLPINPRGTFFENHHRALFFTFTTDMKKYYPTTNHSKEIA
jgi:hypothetical protein